MRSLIHIRSKRMLAGVILAFLCVGACVITRCSLKAALIFAVLFFVCGIVDFREVEIQKARAFWILIWLCVLAYMTLVLSQLIQNESAVSLPMRQQILGFLCCLIPALLIGGITLRFKMIGSAVSLLLLLLSTANYYVYQFRGSELHPSDLTTIGTAINVIDRYTITVPSFVLYSWILFALILFASTALPDYRIKNRKKARVQFLLIAISLIFYFAYSSRFIPVPHFTHGGSYFNGFLLNFTLQINETIIHKPNDYSAQTIRELGEEYVSETENERERNPDIFVIMDEAYSDLGVAGDGLQTNIPVTPFIDSLKVNTTHGYTLSSIYGGGTPNSEYEFLTGNSLLFLNGIVYQQFLRQPSYSLVSELKDRGYKCTAMHPYIETGWRRNAVWPNLMFDECCFLDSFPQQDLVRGLVSDQEMFEFMLDKYNTQLAADDHPVFLFGVTMQNHSPYDYSGDDFQNTIELEGYAGEYSEVEQYLSLIHETDLAIQYLLTELDKVDRDVIVVFYGDHQPAANENFLEEVHGGSFDSLDEKQLLQMVPFFVWTNYESETEEVQLTSLNYLSNILFEKADMDMPPYNLFLEEMEQEIPAMNSSGYYSKTAGQFVELSDADGTEKEWLDKYWMLEYNSLCDVRNLDPVMFPLEE